MEKLTQFLFIKSLVDPGTWKHIEQFIENRTPENRRLGLNGFSLWLIPDATKFADICRRRASAPDAEKYEIYRWAKMQSEFLADLETEAWDFELWHGSILGSSCRTYFIVSTHTGTYCIMEAPRQHPE